MKTAIEETIPKAMKVTVTTMKDTMMETTKIKATMQAAMGETVKEIMKVTVVMMKAMIMETMKIKVLKKMKEAVGITSSPPSPSSLAADPVANDHVKDAQAQGQRDICSCCLPVPTTAKLVTMLCKQIILF